MIVGTPMQPVPEKPACLKSSNQGMIDLLGKSHVLELHYFLFKREGPVRFNELRRELSITATTLSRRLEEFAAMGLVERRVFAEVPARVEYSLSKKGLSLGPVLRHLFTWIQENEGV